MKVKLIKGIDRTFFNLLYDLYYPLLSKSHLKDKYQLTIVDKDSNKPIGILQVNYGKNRFVQIALIPNLRQKEIAKQIILQFMNKANYDKLDWSASKINYPSLKLLYNLGGGIFVNSLKRKTYEGFLRKNKIVSERMRKALEKVLPESKKLYDEWVIHEYNNRKKEKQMLSTYLRNIKSKNINE